MNAQSTTEVWLASAETVTTANERLAQTNATHIVWVEESGVLGVGALQIIEATLARCEVEILYGNSRQSPHGTAHVIRRPAFSPLRLREQDYLGPVIVMNVKWMRSVGGFHNLAAGVHGYDFVLRFDGPSDQVVRVPQVLSIERGVPGNTVAQRLAVERRLSSLAVAASVSNRVDGSRRVEYTPVGDPLVSVIIPTRGSIASIRGDQVALVIQAVAGLIERTDYSNIEVVVVADDPTPQHVIDELVRIAGQRIRLVRFSEEFNFSAKINRGAAYARGDLLLLLNDDTDIIEPGWLSRMVGLAQQPGVGIVGALLLFEDGSVQHGGHVYRQSWPGHIESPEEIGTVDGLGGFDVTREVSGVTAACALVHAEDFYRVGGLSTLFPGNYNDVDFCLKIRSAVGNAVWSPDARLFHFESKTRDATILPDDIARIRERWGTRLLVDQYWQD
jgi:GT2 family glycosyltransferase